MMCCDVESRPATVDGAKGRADVGAPQQTKLMMISNSGRGFRKRLNKYLMNVFPGSFNINGLAPGPTYWYITVAPRTITPRLLTGRQCSRTGSLLGHLASAATATACSRHGGWLRLSTRRVARCAGYHVRAGADYRARIQSGEGVLAHARGAMRLDPVL